MQCRATQQADEMFCARCGLRWDLHDEDRPLCREVKEVREVKRPAPIPPKPKGK